MRHTRLKKQASASSLGGFLGAAEHYRTYRVILTTLLVRVLYEVLHASAASPTRYPKQAQTTSNLRIRIDGVRPRRRVVLVLDEEDETDAPDREATALEAVAARIRRVVSRS